MKKLYILIALMLSACAGYQPLYGELGTEMNKISLHSVQMNVVEKNIGSRRLAQLLDQKLSRIFTNNVNNQYDLYVVLDPTEYAIATRSDDTDKRKSISIKATIKLIDVNTKKQVFKTSISRSSSYTTQDDPFSTESARTKALESITSTLSNEIIQITALWFRGYTQDENNI